MLTPLPWIGSTMKRCDIAFRQRLLQRGEIVERDLNAARHKAAETVAERRIAIERERAVGQPVKGMAAINDVRAAGRAAGELHRGFDRLGPGIGEKHLVEKGHELQQTLGEKARQGRDIHLHEIRQIGRKHRFQGLPHGRMIAADAEDAPAAQEIEITRAALIEQILAAATLEGDIEADGAQSPHHHLVHIKRMKLVSFGFAIFDQCSEIEWTPGTIEPGFLWHCQIIHRGILQHRRALRLRTPTTGRVANRKVCH